MYKRFRKWLSHVINPLNLYCRLYDLGFSQAGAMAVAMAWEWLLRKGGWNDTK